MAALVQLAGGVPIHICGTTVNPAAVEEWRWNGGRSNTIWFQNTGTGPIVLSFSAADATADRGISIAAGVQVQIPAEAVAFWTKSVAAETFQAVVLIHRG